MKHEDPNSFLDLFFEQIHFNVEHLLRNILGGTLTQIPDSIESLKKYVETAKRNLWNDWPPLTILYASNFDGLTSDLDNLEINILECAAGEYWQSYDKGKDPKFLDLLEFCYKRINQLNESDLAHSNLAYVYLEADKPKEALKEALVGVELGKTNPETYITLCTIYAEQGMNKPALDLVNDAIRIFPDHQENFQKLIEKYNLKK